MRQCLLLAGHASSRLGLALSPLLEKLHNVLYYNTTEEGGLHTVQTSRLLLLVGPPLAASTIAVRGRGCTSVVFHLVWQQQQLLAARGRRGHVGVLESSAIAASPNFETLLLLLLTELLLPPRLFFLRRERERENFSVGRRWDEPDQPYEINDIQN